MKDKELMPLITFRLDGEYSDAEYKAKQLKEWLKGTGIKVSYFKNDDKKGNHTETISFDFFNYKKKRPVGSPPKNRKVNMRYSEVLKYKETHTNEELAEYIGLSSRAVDYRLEKFRKNQQMIDDDEWF